MTFLKTTLAVVALVLVSCCSTNKATKDTADTMNADTKMEASKMMEAGFQKGVIVASKAEGDCPFTIRVDGKTDYLLDPVNLDASYQQDGMKIWFTFTGMRMMNRCQKANPVTLNEIQKRAE